MVSTTVTAGFRRLGVGSSVIWGATRPKIRVRTSLGARLSRLETSLVLPLICAEACRGRGGLSTPKRESTSRAFSTFLSFNECSALFKGFPSEFWVP